jgi:hypothetical protein
MYHALRKTLDVTFFCFETDLIVYDLHALNQPATNFNCQQWTLCLV